MSEEDRLDLSRVKYFVHFVGSSKSGHTLVAQILNAHKDVCISNESNTVGRMLNEHGIGRVYQGIYKKSVLFAEHNVWEGRDYTIKGQYQGKTTSPLVLGDKFAASTKYLRDRKTFKRYIKFIQYPIKWVMVTRKMSDNVKAMAKMNGRGIDYSMNRYMDQFMVAYHICGRNDSLQVKLERLLTNPERVIREMCRFLEIDCPEDYLKACCEKIVS